MNKEQAQSEYLKLLHEQISEEEEIQKQAIRNGTWKIGLDANRPLFAETRKKYKDMINRLKEMIDE